jgi:aerobic C4-dicarboxylate transport protein
MAAAIDTTTRARAARPWYKILYVQVLIAILLGIVVGWLSPHLATNDWIKALGDGFIKLIKMLIAPIIFCTVVSGIAHIQDARKVGRVGVKALVYFEVVSSFALILGLLVGNLVPVGRGLGATSDAAAVATYVKQAEAQKSVDFVLNIIPDSVVGALARGDILQVLLFAILFGFALMALGERGRQLRQIIDEAAHGVFGVIAIVMKAAPLGAFGAMAYTIGKFGPAALGNLIGLIAVFYVTAALFVFIVLGLIARFVGFNIFKFLAYIKDELLIVLGTSSSESALPQLMEKLERLGCSKAVVGLVVPTGYSFNLDGTAIYLTMASLFIADAMGTPMSIPQQLGLLAFMIIASKGAAGVSGAGLATLAAGLQSHRPDLLDGVGIIVGIDRFMSEARAVTNFSGNAVATVLVGTWTSSVDGDRLRNVLDGDIPFDERTMIDDGDTEDDASTDEKEPATAGAGH